MKKQVRGLFSVTFTNYKSDSSGKKVSFIDSRILEGVNTGLISAGEDGSPLFCVFDESDANVFSVPQSALIMCERTEITGQQVKPVSNLPSKPKGPRPL